MSIFRPATDTEIRAVKNLSRDQRDILFDEINRTNPQSVFQPAGESKSADKAKIICPNCGNGTGDSATPVEANFEDGVWLYHCFKNKDLEGRLTDIIAKEEHLTPRKFDDLCKLLAIGASVAGISVDTFTDQNYTSPRPATKPARQSIDIKDTPEFKKIVQTDIDEALNHVDDWPKDQRRGLTDKTIRHFKFGYLPRWIHPNLRAEGKQGTPTRRIIAPTESGLHYNAIALPADRKSDPKYLHEKPKLHAGYMELFNSAALTTNDDLVVVVEGEFDAASLWQAFDGNISVVAVLGCGNWKKTLLPKLDGVSNKKFLILFDAEQDTRKAARELRDVLINRGFPAACRFFYDALTSRLENGQPVKFEFGVKVDGNEILFKTDTYFLRTLTNDIIADARDDIEEAEKEIADRLAEPPAQADDDDDSPKSRKAASLVMIESLSTEPQSADRDRKLISAIKDCLEWSGGNNPYIKPTYKNLRFIFDHDPALRGLFGFDQFEGVTVFLREPPWKRTTNFRRQWTDDDDAQLRLYLRQHYNDLACRQLTDDLSAELKSENSFNVVKEFFYNLPEWDGVKRAENLFVKFLRVDDTAYAREVTLNWLTGAIARIFHPGCRYHTALVLHGAQKIGKSYVIERLGGRWYGAISDRIDDPHAIDAIQNLWLCEFKELAAMRKIDVNRIKEFIELSTDNRREPYARRAKMTPRHVVFAITVNDDGFLRDVTGNRRFMILHSNSQKFQYIDGLTDEYIQQVWAEVYAHYKELFADGFDEHLLQLSRDTERQAEEIADQYLQDDGLTTEIKSFLDEKILPQVIWQLLSRDERRQFFVHKEFKLFDGRYALEQRIKARYQGNISKINSALGKLSNFLEDETCTRFTVINDSRTYHFAGTEYRQHICAAEIFNECFGHDSRKRMPRINEILSQLDGWELRGNGRLQKADPAYADQKKAFWRIEQPADATLEQTNDPLQGVIVNDEDIPF